MKPNPSVMNRIEYYSILSRNIKITLLQLRKTKLLIRGLNITIPSFNDLNDVESELMKRYQEIENATRLLIEPLLEGIDFGHRYLDHWSLSMYDIKCGYCELEEILQYNKNAPIRFGRKFIMLVSDYDDSTLGKFYSGELIPFQTAIHFIDKIPKREDKIKGLHDAVIKTIELAARHRAKKPMK